MKVTALALDPIEKKPLARFHPGSRILSVGGIGCTMHCPWCQNHSIAQPVDPCAVPCREMSEGELVAQALALVGEGNIGLAYTYNEPLTHWREVLSCARAIHDAGLLNVVVTNGLIASTHLEELLEHVDVFNIDLKGFSQSVYDLTGGRIETVKQTISLASERAHVEVTTLVIPGINDDMKLIEAQAAWLASIDESITLHLTRFFPCHEFTDTPPTPRETLLRAKRVAEVHLPHVMLGNV